MAVTILTSSWLGYEAATGQLVFWDGATYRPLEEAAGYSTEGHGHAVADVTGLQAALDGKLPLAGGTMTGTLAVPQIDLAATTLTGDGTSLFVATQKVWTAGNDGAGSGLDADTLDGNDSGYFTDVPARLGYTPFNRAGDSIGGTALTGDGTSLFVATQKVWTQGNDGAGSGLDADTLDGNDSGYFTDVPARLGYTPFNRAGDSIGGTALTGDGTSLFVATQKVWTQGNDGAGSGLDADTLDGNDSGYFTDVPARLGYTPFNKAGDSLGGTALTGDGTSLFVGGVAVELVGQGHYELKTITRLTAGTSVAIASDTRAALIRGVGGGGGGGGAQGGAAGGAAGGGGAGGAFFEAFKTDVAGQTLTYAIGAAGTAGASTGGNGGTGGTTSISRGATWTLSAAGGVGGNGQANAAFVQATAGGYGQNATGGDLNIGGEAGQGAFRFDASNNLAGKGASSRFGAGGQGYSGNAAGQQGLGRGAGGGGGAVASNATGQAGGAGSAGYIEIWEFT